MQPGQHVFLSYAKEDEAAVRRVHVRLRKDGFRLWLDEHDLLPGQDWEGVIRSAISGSAAFIVFLSLNAATKTGFVQKEIRVALEMTERMPEGTVFIVPVLLERCAVPERLAKWHWIDIHERGGYKKLSNVLRKHAPTACRTRSETLTEPANEFSDPREFYLYEIFRQSERFLYGRLDRRRYVFGQGHFLVVLPDFPSVFRALQGTLTVSRRLSRVSVQSLFPRDASWRKVDGMVTSDGGGVKLIHFGGVKLIRPFVQ